MTRRHGKALVVWTPPPPPPPPDPNRIRAADPGKPAARQPAEPGRHVDSLAIDLAEWQAMTWPARIRRYWPHVWTIIRGPDWWRR